MLDVRQEGEGGREREGGRDEIESKGGGRGKKEGGRYEGESKADKSSSWYGISKCEIIL